MVLTQPPQSNACNKCRIALKGTALIMATRVDMGRRRRADQDMFCNGRYTYILKERMCTSTIWDDTSHPFIMILGWLMALGLHIVPPIWSSLHVGPTRKVGRIISWSSLWSMANLMFFKQVDRFLWCCANNHAIFIQLWLRKSKK